MGETNAVAVVKSTIVGRSQVNGICNKLGLRFFAGRKGHAHGIELSCGREASVVETTRRSDLTQYTLTLPDLTERGLRAVLAALERASCR